ncbi:MAG TPA: ParB N-terminal domain-containing protein [Anaeromyxobacteraceae bacterium]|nr:ParB N-terminal domain-containing protein [Anaeromyxobacteraceae bacterium]
MPLEREQRSAAPAHATGAVEFIALEDIGPDEAFRLRPDGDVADLATSLGRLGQLVPVELRPWPGAPSEGPRWQVVAGFRRLAAVRLLARERVLARLHAELSDGDAWGVVLTQALLQEPLGEVELGSLRERLEASGVAPWAEELVEDALARAPVSPELRESFLQFLAAGTRRAGGQDPSPQPSPLTGERGEVVSSLSPDDGEKGEVVSSLSPDGGEGRVRGDDGDPSTIEVTPEELVTDLATRLSAVNQDLAIAFEAWEDLPAEGRRLLVEQARYVAALLPFLEAE